ncbi:MAG: FtsK/SpoIIIE domain-containing protein [Chloroflexota bacterium]
MPQLFSRMDNLNWLTPTIADILDQGAAPPGGDGSIREQMLELQDRLADLDTPARVVNVRPTPSFTLFIVKPDVVGRMGGRRAVTTTEIKRSLAQIAEDRRDWRLGFMPSITDTPDAVGILLRTNTHRPLSLRRMLVRTAFREHPSRLAFCAGSTLDQVLKVVDLAEIGSLLIAGQGNARSHLLHSVLITLLLLNTPGELRLALAGERATQLKAFMQTPHMLGRPLTKPQESLRLLEGLVSEMRRRLSTFDEEGSDSIETHNARLIETNQTIVPRITLIIDSLSDPSWMQQQAQIVPHLVEIARKGARAGIHMIVQADGLDTENVPDEVHQSVHGIFALSGAAGSLTENLEDFHGSLMRFIDALYIDQTADMITPVEIAAIQPEEINRLLLYWQGATRQRQRDSQMPQVSGKTGVTQTLDQSRVQAYMAQKDADNTATQESLRVHQKEADTPAPAAPLQVSLHQAQALAAYLGWIGAGPLQDIFSMSPEEAARTVLALREMGIVEDTDSPTPRFLRPTN